MKFVDRLKISSLLSFSLLLVLVPLLIWVFGEMKHAEDEDNLADDLQTVIFKRSTLRDEFFVYGVERARLQGLALNEDIRKMLQKGERQFTDREEQLVLKDLQGNFDQAVEIFLRFAELQRRSGNGRLVIDGELGKRLHGQVMLKSSAMQEAAARLQKLSRVRYQHYVNRAMVFTGIFAVLVGVITILNAAVINRLFRKRLETLRTGADLIACGGLDHRLDCSGSDELADLGKVLNVMTARVQDYMEQIYQSEKRYRLQLQELVNIYAQAPDGLFAVDRELRYLRINEQLAQINGRSVAAHLHRTIDEVLPAELAATLKEIWRPIFEQGESVLNLEVQGSRYGAPGRHHWLTSYVPIFSDSGEVCGITGTVTDISDRKHTEHELEVCIAFLRLVNQSLGARELVASASAFFQRHSGCRTAAIRLREGKHHPFVEVLGTAGSVPPGSKLCSLQDCGAGGGACDLDCLCDDVMCGRVERAPGSLTRGGSFWTNGVTKWLAELTDPLETRACPRCCQGDESVALIPMPGGEFGLGLLQLSDPGKDRFSPQSINLWERLAGHLAVALAKFRSKEELRKSKELLQAVINGTSDLIYVKDLSGRYLLLNKEAERFVGDKARELIGKDDYFLHPAEFAEPLMHNDRQVMASGTVITTKEFVADTAGGHTFLSTKGPLYDEHGSITGIFGVSRDITLMVEAEEALTANQEQLRSLAIELSAVEERERRRIATELHDEIGQHLALTKIKLDDISKVRQSARNAQSLREIGNLVERTIQEVRSLTFQISPPLLYEVGFEAAVEWLAEEFENKHQLKISVYNDDAPKLLDEQLNSTIYHVVRELLVNVVKHAQAKKVSISLARDGNRIKIAVKDSGRGFDVASPGKDPKKLNGFGLFNIRQRIQHLGGQVAIESEVGIGTTVTMDIPLGGS
jgi:two-component system, NarL family, sensor histidine kinase UhpB